MIITVQISVLVSGSRTRVPSLFTAFTSSKKGTEAAQKAYEVTQGRYEVGSSNFVDLITAQAALVQAESSRAQALIGFLLQTKTVDFAQGLTPVN